MSETDLLGDPVERRTYSDGYAGPPGSGPDNETCGSCYFFYRQRYHGKTYFKCGHGGWKFTRSEHTDIRKGSPACLHWLPTEKG